MRNKFLVDKENGLEKDSKLLLNRIQTIDVKLRLRDYIGYVGSEILRKAQLALKVVAGMDYVFKRLAGSQRKPNGLKTVISLTVSSTSF